MAALPFCYPEVKIEKLCRTCLCKDGELHSIFDIHRGAETLDYIITTVTGVKIQPNDHLPKSVCHDCKKKATSAFDFKKKAQESDISLQKLVKTENFKIELEIKNIVPAKNIKIEQTAEVDFDMDNMDIDYGSFSGLDDDYRETDAVKMESQGDSMYIPLNCDICSGYFDSEESLRNHLKNSCLKVECNGESGSYCPLCGTCYSTSQSLAKHMSEKHSELMLPTHKGRARQTNNILSKLSENGFLIKTVNLKKYNCVFCKKQFKKKEELSDHTMVHREVKVYSCVLCKKMFVKKSQFGKHSCICENNVKNEKNEDEISTEATAESKLMGLLHEMTLQNVVGRSDYTGNIMMPNVCAMCSEIFISSSDLLNHIDEVHPEKSQRCNICLKVFATLKSAGRHRKICKNIERKFHCSVCGLKFAHEITLNKHILSNHEGESVSVNFMNSKQKLERKFQCDTCKKCFFRKEKLERHTKTHMPSEKIFECDICLRKFNRKDNMKSHKKTHEPRTDVKPNTCLCLYCGRSFNNSSNLIVHMRRHTGEKPYKCDFCGKGFPRSSDLQSHRRSHTGEKPWDCKVCGKAFSRSNKLSRHMRIHTGLRPYKCTYCDKAFTQSNDLTLHIRRHTGDKPYICDVCGDRFIQGTALQNHRRAHGHFPTTTTETPQTGRPILLRITNDENGVLKLNNP